MKVRVISAAAITSTGLSLTAAAALAALSVGADAGYSARSARHVTPKRGFTLRAAPAQAAVSAGSAARYRITIRRHRFAGRVALSLSPRPPAGTTARFSPSRTRRSSATLTILTPRQMAPGLYRIHLRARGAKLTRSSWLTLTIAASPAGTTGHGTTGPGTTGPGTTGPGTTGPGTTGPGTGQGNGGQPFVIAGNVEGPLHPGEPQPIDLQITNPNASPLVVNSLTASVGAISAPQATASLPCTLSDFSVQAFSGSLPLTVPASSTRTLAELGVPTAQWPQISIVDLPTNQDGCRTASVTLAYAGIATGG
jgi:hypothetical protein